MKRILSLALLNTWTINVLDVSIAFGNVLTRFRNTIPLTGWFASATCVLIGWPSKLNRVCKQAAPHDAITIETVDQPTIAEQTNCDSHLDRGMYPEAAPSSITKPTTLYRSTKDLQSAQWSPLQGNQTLSKERERSSLALVFMLVMTQWGLGMIIGNMFLGENSYVVAQVLASCLGLDSL